MTPPQGLEFAIVAGSLGAAVVGTVAALRARAASHASLLALRLAAERERAFVDAARRLCDAAAVSSEAVRAEIVAVVQTIAPDIDAISFFEERDVQLTCIAAFGERVRYFLGTHVALDDADALIVRARMRAHRVTREGESDARPLHPGDRFAAAIPLTLEAGRTCVLALGATHAIAPATVDRVVVAVDLAAPSYRIARERDDDRQRAEYDGLTGLLSPRAFRVRFTETIERARFRPRGRVALLFIDTDHFKAWNDSYGHASGDALLRELAAMLRQSATQPGDFAARNGGDEFCVVFADAEKSMAIERAEALRIRIAEADFSGLRPVGSRPDVRISASIGVAAFPVDAGAANELLERSDEAMYHSKRTGRNAVAYFGVDGSMYRLEAVASVPS